MPYYKEGNLAKLLKERKKSKNSLPEDDIRHYAAMIINGVQYIHDSEVVHRDIKPENLMIDDGGYLKIIDFGLAQILSEGNFIES